MEWFVPAQFQAIICPPPHFSPNAPHTKNSFVDKCFRPTKEKTSETELNKWSRKTKNHCSPILSKYPNRISWNCWNPITWWRQNTWTSDKQRMTGSRVGEVVLNICITINHFHETGNTIWRNSHPLSIHLPILIKICGVFFWLGQRTIPYSHKEHKWTPFSQSIVPAGEMHNSYSSSPSSSLFCSFCQRLYVFAAFEDQ